MSKINKLYAIRDSTIQIMMDAWKYGRKHIESNPYVAEMHFRMGDTACAFLKIVNEDIQEEITKWQQ